MYSWNLLTAHYWSCLSVSFSLSYMPCQYTGLRNSAVKQQMPLPTMLLLYWFWLTEICSISPETRRVTYKLHSQWHSCFHFSILPVLYTQDTFAPFSNFEVSHFACHFLFLSFSVAMKGIQFTQLHCYISFLSFTQLTTYFLSSCGWLLNSCKRQLFHLHIQHATCCLFEWRTLVGSLEAVVCGFCLSISLPFNYPTWIKSCTHVFVWDPVRSSTLQLLYRS